MDKHTDELLHKRDVCSDSMHFRTWINDRWWHDLDYVTSSKLSIWFTMCASDSERCYFKINQSTVHNLYDRKKRFKVVFSLCWLLKFQWIAVSGLRIVNLPAQIIFSIIFKVDLVFCSNFFFTLCFMTVDHYYKIWLLFFFPFASHIMCESYLFFLKWTKDGVDWWDENELMDSVQMRWITIELVFFGRILRIANLLRCSFVIVPQ